MFVFVLTLEQQPATQEKGFTVEEKTHRVELKDRLNSWCNAFVAEISAELPTLCSIAEERVRQAVPCPSTIDVFEKRLFVMETGVAHMKRTLAAHKERPSTQATLIRLAAIEPFLASLKTHLSLLHQIPKKEYPPVSRRAILDVVATRDKIDTFVLHTIHTGITGNQFPSIREDLLIDSISHAIKHRQNMLADKQEELERRRTVAEAEVGVYLAKRRRLASSSLARGVAL